MRMMPALALTLAVIAAPAMAQIPSAPSDAAIGSATAMVEAISPAAREKTAFDAQMANIRRGALLAQMIGNNPRVREAAQKDKAAVEAMLGRAGALQADALAPIFAQRVAAIRQGNIQAFASRFTIAELNAIAAFYKSGAGAKLLTAQPTIAAEVTRTVNAQYAPNVEAAQKAIAPRVEAEIKTMFPDQPAAPAPAPAAKR